MVGVAFEPEERFSSAGATFCEVTRDSLEALRSRLVVVGYAHLSARKHCFDFVCVTIEEGVTAVVGKVRE